MPRKMGVRDRDSRDQEFDVGTEPGTPNESKEIEVEERDEMRCADQGKYIVARDSNLLSQLVEAAPPLVMTLQVALGKLPAGIAVLQVRHADDGAIKCVHSRLFFQSKCANRFLKIRQEISSTNNFCRDDMSSTEFISGKLIVFSIRFV